MRRVFYLELALMLLGTAVFCLGAFVVWVMLFIPVMIYPRIVQNLTTENMARFTLARMMGTYKRASNGDQKNGREVTKPLPSLPGPGIASPGPGVVLFCYRENTGKVTKMSSTLVSTERGDVRVTNMPTVTTYYRGRYYRTLRTVCTIPSGFRMLTADTFLYGIPSSLRWFSADPATVKHTTGRRYDNSHDTMEAPF